MRLILLQKIPSRIQCHINRPMSVLHTDYPKTLLSCQHGQGRSQIHLHHHKNVQHQQIRCLSIETYNKYFSPELPPIGFAQKVFEGIHSATGLPWWASIALTTFTVRTLITLPLAVYSMKVMVRVEKIQPEIMEISKRLTQEVAMAVKEFGWDKSKARREYNKNMLRHVRNLYIRDNCHPSKNTVVLWAQIPMWIFMSFALRNMSGATLVDGVGIPLLCPEMSTEGTLWFSDLTLPDSTWLLPLTFGALNLINIELHALEAPAVTRFRKVLTFVLRGLTFVMVPVAASVPSCMAFYWTCSTLSALLQNIVLRFPKVRRAVGIPKSEREKDAPFQYIFQAAKTKYSWSGLKSRLKQKNDS